MDIVARTIEAVATGLVDPSERLADARRPRPSLVWGGILIASSLMGLLTVPRQLAHLIRVMPVLPEPLLGAQQDAVRQGLTRMIIADRLIPSPTLLLAAVLVAVAAEPVLSLAVSRRRVVWLAAGMGLAPLLVQRVGELAISFLLPVASVMTAGDVLELPHKFVTGPLLLWRSSLPAPAWLEVLDPRLSLITLWSVVLWTRALAALDQRGRVELWHVLLPAGCLALAGVITWATAPLVVAAVLRLG